LKPIPPALVPTMEVRDQYREGVIKGRRVLAYLDEKSVECARTTETFVALKVDIEIWRHAGVAFFLRTGKRLAVRRSAANR
jgi:glucose-6-phosphate 1-dehydrogenase